jgi:hypothetical protein
VRVREPLGLRSDLDRARWTQNVVYPSAPTLVALDQYPDPQDDGWDCPVVVIDVTEPPGSNTAYETTYLDLQYSDDLGVTWKDHRGSGVQFTTASNPPTVQIIDTETPLVLERHYRARVYTTDQSEGRALDGAWSFTIATNVMVDNQWWVGIPGDHTTFLPLMAQTFSITESKRTGVFKPMGGKAVVIKDDTTTRDITINCQTLNEDDFAKMIALLDAEAFVLRDGLGRVFYLACDGEYDYDLVLGARGGTGGKFTTGHMHEWTINCVEVEAP